MRRSGTTRNLAFGHPDFDEDLSPGLQWSPRGGLRFVEGRDAVRQALLLLLTTSRGERVMRPEYGCDLERVVFMPNDETTAGLAIHYVRTAIRTWEPRVEITDIDAYPEPYGDPGALLIRLRYRLRTTGELDELTHTLFFAGEVR